jgi:cephalosporin hydroxylase
LRFKRRRLRQDNSGSAVDRFVADFVALYQPDRQGDLPEPAVRDAIVEQFHRLYYCDSEQTWRSTRYRGVEIQKCPLDLWMYQEIIHEVRPDLIVETGTAHGGSAYFLADFLETVGGGRVVSVDIDDALVRPSHPGVTYVAGSSVDPAVLAEVRQHVENAATVMVVLDSDHRRDHVRAELEHYSPFVSPGSYLIVEDTNIGGHPVQTPIRDGPYEAVEDFLAGNPAFAVDRTRERLMMTLNPSGYLRRAPHA